MAKMKIKIWKKKTTNKTDAIPTLKYLYTPIYPPPIKKAISNTQVSHDNKIWKNIKNKKLYAKNTLTLN